MVKTMIQKIKKLPNVVLAGVVFIACNFMQKGISVLTTPIFTRLMSTEEYGLYSVFVSWTNIFTIFITLKIAAGTLQQSLVKYEEDKNNLLASAQGISLFLALIAIAIYLIIPDFWENITGMSGNLIIAMIISIWATNAFEIWAQGKRVNYDYKKLALITIAAIILKPAAGIVSILLFPNMKVEARIYSLVIVEILLYIGIFISQITHGKFYSKKYWKQAITFNLPLIPHYLSQQILSQTDRLMINYYSGASAAGIYSLAYQISMVFTLFNSALSSVLNPWIYKCLKRKDYKRIAPLTNFIFICLAILNIILILLAPEILSIFAPSSYYEALWTIPPITMSCIFMYLYSVFVCFEFYYEKKQYIVYASIICAFLNFVSNMLLIPKLGYIAAAYTTLTCYVLYCIMHYLYMKKTCKDNSLPTDIFNIKIILLESFLFIGIGLSIMIFYNNLIIRLILLLILIIIGILNCNKIKQNLKLLFVRRSYEKN